MMLLHGNIPMSLDVQLFRNSILNLSVLIFIYDLKTSDCHSTLHGVYQDQVCQIFFSFSEVGWAVRCENAMELVGHPWSL